MDTPQIVTPAHLTRSFGRLGMRIKAAPMPAPAWRTQIVPKFDLDVSRDRHGEFFLLRVGQEQPDFLALDVQPDLKQLLLLARSGEDKQKFLCGFDERHLFTAAVPGQSIRSVRDAMSALKPAFVRAQEQREGVRAKDRLRRHNAASLRQGEWFFIPAPELVVPAERIHRHEPLSRGMGSKPHLCTEAARIGGEVVWVCSRFPGGVTESRYRQYIQSRPESRGWNWQQRYRNPELYVRGEVRHKDHATIHLNIWHRVLMNTEHEAPGARFVAFLD